MLVNYIFQLSFLPTVFFFLFHLGNTPQFISVPTTLSVDEDIAVGTTLITVTATDADLSDNLTYTLMSTSPVSTSFNFDPISGYLLFLDFFY